MPLALVITVLSSKNISLSLSLIFSVICFLVQVVHDDGSVSFFIMLDNHVTMSCHPLAIRISSDLRDGVYIC